MAWTANRFLRGAGADTNPVEIPILGEFDFRPLAWEWQLDFASWTATTTGSGTAERSYGLCRVSTGTTANSTARARGYLFGWLIWDITPITMYCRICARISVATSTRWYKLDTDTAANPTGQAIGWRLDNLTLTGIWHNGTTLYVTDPPLMTLISGEAYDFYLVYNPGQYIRWYVDGDLKGETTSNLPTGLRQVNHHLVTAITNGGTGTNCSLEIWRQGWRWGV